MFSKFQKYFFAGLAAFLPIALTVYLLVISFNLLDGILGKYLAPYFRREFGFYIRGVGIFLFIAIITMIGVFVKTFIDRRIYSFFENLLIRLPFFKQVYPAVKEIASFLLPQDKPAFQQVVIVEYPRKGIYTVGFLTNASSKELCRSVGEELCNVLISSVPNPLTGFVILVPKKDLLFPNITVEEAVKLIVSGGVVNPIDKNGQDKLNTQHKAA